MNNRWIPCAALAVAAAPALAAGTPANSFPMPGTLAVPAGGAVVVQVQPQRADSQWIQIESNWYWMAEAESIVTERDSKTALIKSPIVSGGKWMLAQPPGGWMEFEIAAPAAATYYFTARLPQYGNTESMAEVLVDGQTNGTLVGHDWSKPVAVALAAGPHRIRLVEANEKVVLRPSNRLLNVDVLALTTDARWKPAPHLAADPLSPTNTLWQPRPFARISRLEINGAPRKREWAGNWCDADLLLLDSAGRALSTASAVTSGVPVPPAAPCVLSANGPARAALRTFPRAGVVAAKPALITANGDLVDDETTLAAGNQSGLLLVQTFDGRAVAERKIQMAPATWDGLDNQKQAVPANSYLLLFRPSDGGTPLISAVRTDPDVPPLTRTSVRTFTPNQDGVYDDVEVAFKVQPASGESIGVRAADGRKIRTALPRATNAQRQVAVTWDGRDAGGALCPAGRYEIALWSAAGVLRTGARVVLENRRPWPQQAYREPFFPLGVWASGPGLSIAAMDRFFTDLTNHGCNAAYLGNGLRTSVLARAQMHGVRVIADFNSTTLALLNAKEAPTEAEIEAAARPQMDVLRDQPALLAYYISDEPGWSEDMARRLRAVQQVMGGIDPRHPALVCLIGIDRVEKYARALQPPVLLIDIYPLHGSSKPGQFNGIYATKMDMMEYLDRSLAGVTNTGAPAWIIHAAHGFGDWHREPSPAELRLQTWLSLTRGVDGILYFFYETQQLWNGLIDEKGNETERWKTLGELYRFLRSQESLLTRLRPAPAAATLAGGGNAFYKAGEIGTLTDGRDSYLVVANHDVEAPAKLTLTLTGATTASGLLDLRAGRIVPVLAGQASLQLEPGDGTILKRLR